MNHKTFYDEKEHEYFQNVRSELISEIPPDVKKILDVGCGQGATGHAIKQNLDIDEIVGIELLENAARVAKTKLDKVIVGDIETLDLDFKKGYFDCILFADVLEHTQDPWNVLYKFRPYLHDDGIVIMSIPNLRHIAPVLKIIFDRFDYEPLGILDKSHLRFFTLYTIKNMIKESGYKILEIKPKKSNTLKERLLRYCSLGLFNDFTIFQYIIKAAKNPA